MKSLVQEGFRIQVHDIGDHALDGMLRLVELATQPRPLREILNAMCALVADIARADVVSIYLREATSEGEVLTLEGNHGFPTHAVGRVQLRLVEGLTGFVAERRRPVSVAVAQDDHRYKHVEGIGEDKFPAFLGVPLLRHIEASGVLVLQRRRPRVFTPIEVTLASSLTGPFICAIERAHGYAVVNGTTPGAAAPPVQLQGVPLVPGMAVGRASRLADADAPPQAGALAAGVAVLEADLSGAHRRLGATRSPQVARALENMSQALTNLALGDTSDQARAGLERVPYRVGRGEHEPMDALLAERALEMQDLWALLRAATQPQFAPRGAIVVAPRLSGFLALIAAARGVAGLVATAPGATSPGVAVAHASRIPTIIGVVGLARVRPDDVLALDAHQGSAQILLPTPA